MKKFAIVMAVAALLFTGYFAPALSFAEKAAVQSEAGVDTTSHVVTPTGDY